MAEALWYYEDAGKPAGPVSEAALAEAIRQGRLARGQRVWTAGQSGWVAWEALPALAALVPPEPTIVPPSVPTTPSGWSPPEAPPATSGWGPPPAAAAEAAGRYPRAPLWPRFVAALVDGLIGGGPMMLALGLFAGFSGGLLDSNASAAPLAALAVAGLLWALWYTFTKDGRAGGQSIGKRLMGLMVVHLPTSRPCTLAQSALRALVLVVLQMVPLVGVAIEPVALLVAADGRRLGDKAAGTQVILASGWRPPR
jgi:uncharacterized RDD family membrane protein YckC